MATMRAWVVHGPGGPDVLSLDSSRQRPRCPEFDGVLVRIKAFGLNRAEVLTREGFSGTAVDLSDRILGVELAGVVEEVSPDLERHEYKAAAGRYAKGDVVVALMGGLGRQFDGSYAEYAAVPARSLSAPLKLDADMPSRAPYPFPSWSTLASVPVTFTTAHGILSVSLATQSGQDLLIHGGSSSLGLALLHLARTPSFNLSRIVGTTRDETKREVLLKGGFDEVIVAPERKEQDEDASAAIRAIKANDREGFDNSVELIGTTNLAVSLQCAKQPGGKVCSAGGLAHGWTLDNWSLANIPSGVSLCRYTSDMYDRNNDSLPELIDLVISGHLDPGIDRIFAFEELQEAHRYMDANSACGKIVCVVASHLWMTSKGVQSSLKGFFKPSSPPKTGKRPTAAIDLDADSADEARPSKFQRTSSSAQIAPIDAEENGVEAITSLSVDIEDFELPLNANTFHTIRGPSFRIEDAFSPPSNTGRQITKSLLDLLYLKSFLVAPARKQLYDWLLAELPWYRVCYEVRGISIKTPRYTTVYGIDAAPKPLSSYQRRPRPIPPVLDRLRQEVERRTDAKFNFCLVNYYADGNDSISFHQDSEQFLGPTPTIASLTVGAPRDFLMRPKKEKGVKNDKPEKWLLESGDMGHARSDASQLGTFDTEASEQQRSKRALHSGGTNNYYRYNVGDGPMFRWSSTEQAMVEAKW